EEAAAAAESMQEQAAKLADVVGLFKLDATQHYVSASAGTSVTASAQVKAATRPVMRPAKHRASAPAVAAPASGKSAQADAMRARPPKSPVVSGADEWEEF
ncbi:MAG: hypothetical protein RSE46_14340, partial [Janthinobacterium sp.]